MKKVTGWWNATKSLWGYVYQVDKKIIWLTIVPVLNGLFQPIFTGFAMKPATEAINSGSLTSLIPLAPYAIAYGIGYVIYLVFNVQIAMFIAEIEIRYENKLKESTLRHSYWFPYEWKINARFAERIERFQRYQNQLTSFIEDQLHVIISITTAVIGLGLVIQFDWVVLCLMLGLALLSVLGYSKTARIIFEHEHDSEESFTNRRASILMSHADFPTNTLNHLSNSFMYFLGIALQANIEDQKRELERKKMQLKNDTITRIIEIVAKLILFGYVAYQSFNGKAIQVIPAYLAGFMFYQGLLGIMRSIADQANLTRKVNLIFDVLQEAQEIEEADRLKLEPDISESFNVTFSNTTYRYPNGEEENSNPLVFDNVNMQMDLKKLNALIGRNGGGKSTLIMLICGKIFPISGEVCINDIPTTRIKNEWFSKTFCCYIPEMYPIDTLTIRELLNPSQTQDDSYLLSILTKVGLGQKITSLSTIVGPYSNGTDFSAGEAQRLMIARLIVQADSESCSYLLADEITSNIAPGDQVALIKVIKKYVKRGILITHNLVISRECCDCTIEKTDNDLIYN